VSVSVEHRSSSISLASWLPIALMCVAWIGVVGWLLSTGRTGDLDRFVEIAHGGTLYVDQAIEYPPLQAGLIVILGHWTASVAVVLTALVNAIATLTCWRSLRRGWSPVVATSFLWFALPMQAFMPVRLDMISVAMTVGAITLAKRDKPTLAGVVFAGAILFRVWPLVVVPVVLLPRYRRAGVVTVAVVVLGGLTWLAAFGGSAFQQVASYRGATGWQIETPLGLAALIRSGGRFVLDAGAARAGDMHAWEIGVFQVLGIAATIAAAVIARRRDVDPAGGPSLGVVASLVLFSPVASPQYVSWILPWAAIVSSERRSWDVDTATIAAGVFASAVFAAYWGSRFDLTGFVAAAAGRIVAIAVLASIGFTHRRVDRSVGDHPVGEAVKT
jgi:Glycosyltransferase family 87